MFVTVFSFNDNLLKFFCCKSQKLLWTGVINSDTGN